MNLFDYLLKTCTKCGRDKPTIEFYGNRRDCIPCNKAVKRRRYIRDERVRRRQIEAAQRWRDENRERYLEYQRRYKLQNRERIQRAERSRHLMKQYGITLDEYEAMSEAQRHRRAICGDTEKGGLHVDHDHRTGNVRGLLCGRCNKAIGLFDDDPARVRAAERYLVETMRKPTERTRPT